jgi:microcin C transport system substrate-binding protein
MKKLFLGLFLLSLSLAADEDRFPPQALPQAKPSDYADEKAVPVDLKWENGPESLQPWGSPKAKKGGTLRNSLTVYPRNFRHFGPESNTSFRSFLDYLNLAQLNFDPNHPEITLPSLCIQWAPDKDQKTLYFRIDPSARWSDGQPVLASDFSFVMEMVHDPDLEHPDFAESVKQWVEAITPHGRLSFSVRMRNILPADERLYYSSLWPVPRHFWKNFQDALGHKNYGALIPNWWRHFDEAQLVEPVTGPYNIDIQLSQPQRSVVFSKVKNWWSEKKPWNLGRYNVDQVEYRVINDIELLDIQFEINELDVNFMTTPGSWQKNAKAECFQQAWAYRIMAYNQVPQPMMGVYLNTRRAPFDDVKVRQAFAHALDIDGMIAKVLNGDYAHLPRITTGYGKYDNKLIKPWTYDPASATKLLGAAGWSSQDGDGVRMKNGQRLVIEIDYTTEGHLPRLRWLQQQALKVGFELQLNRYETATFFDRIKRRDHQATWTGWQGNYFPDYRDGYYSESADLAESNSTCNYKDPEVDMLIKIMETTRDSAEKVKAAHRIQQIIHEQALVVPLYYVPYIRSGAWNWVKLPEVVSTRTNGDEIFEAFGISGGLFWIDEEEKKRTLEARQAKQKLGEPKTIVDPTWKMAE